MQGTHRALSLLGLNGFEYFLTAGLGRDGGGGWGPTTHSGDVLGLTGYTLGDVEFGGGQTDGVPDDLLHHFNIHKVRGVLQDTGGTYNTGTQIGHYKLIIFGM